MTKTIATNENLIAVLSHDLKNPLAGISLNLQVVLKKLADAEKNSDSIKIDTIRTSLERAEKSSKRMLDLIQTLDQRSSPEPASSQAPTQASIQAPTQASGHKPASEAKKERILIIDDDELLGETIAETLRDRGFQADCVMNAEEGIELLAAHQSKFSFVIADYNLPGMSGGQFAKTLRDGKGENSSLPIILCSAEQDIQEMAKSFPVNATLSKPVNLANFVQLVEQTLKNQKIDVIPAKSVNNYLIRRGDDLQACFQALEKNDYETVRSIAHRIKGSASTFGFPELSEIARTLELAASTADSKSLQASVDDFKRWVDQHLPNQAPRPH